MYSGKFSRWITALLVALCIQFSTPAYAGLTIARTFDASFANAGANQANAQAAVDTAIAAVQALYTGVNGTIPILFKFNASLNGGASTNFTLNNVSYNSYRTALSNAASAANGQNATLTSALAFLPASGTVTQQISVNDAFYALIMGQQLFKCFDASGTFVSACGAVYTAVITVSVSSNPTQYYASTTGLNSQAVSAAEHELNEALGGGGAGTTLSNTSVGTPTKYGTIDLYRYLSNGTGCTVATGLSTTRSWDKTSGLVTCYSINGGSSAISDESGRPIRMSQVTTGADYGDFDNSNGAHIQNAIGSSVLAPVYTTASPEFKMMQSIGYWQLALISQVITFTSTPPTNAILGGTYSLTATGGASGNPVIFSSATPSFCSVTGATVSYIAAGTCTINADQAGNASYNPAAQVQQSFTINRQAQAIIFTSALPPDAIQGGATYLVTATGGASGNPVTFTSGDTSVCTIAGSTVTFVHAGTCIINANQAGNATFNAAPTAVFKIAVGIKKAWVAGTAGAGVNPCTRLAPCRSLGDVIGVATLKPGGEIVVLNPTDDSGQLYLNQAVSIQGNRNYNFAVASQDYAITISAGENDTVFIRGLNLSGMNSTNFGIRILGGANIYIIDCTIQDFVGAGISLESGGRVFVQNSKLLHNGVGLAVNAPSQVISVTRSLLDGNAIGISAQNGGIIGLAHTIINASPTSVEMVNGGQVYSIGQSNVIGANGAVTASLLFQ